MAFTKINVDPTRTVEVTPGVFALEVNVYHDGKETDPLGVYEPGTPNKVKARALLREVDGKEIWYATLIGEHTINYGQMNNQWGIPLIADRALPTDRQVILRKAEHPTYFKDDWLVDVGPQEYESILKEFMKSRKTSTAQESLERNLRSLYPEIEDKHIDVILKNEAMHELTGGFSSGLVTSSEYRVIKQARKDLIQKELAAYSMPFFGKHDLFPHKVHGVVDMDKSSLLVMNNMNSQAPANYYTGFDVRNMDGFIKHGLFMLKVFHVLANEYLSDNNDSFSPVVYKTLDDIPHHEAIRIPLTGTKNAVVREFLKDTPKDFVNELTGIIETSLAYCNTIKKAIHGDAKIGNFANMYFIDHAMTGLGPEIKDIAYFLSEPGFKLKTNGFSHYLGEYINMESDKYDLAKTPEPEAKEMHEYFYNVLIQELSLRLSVMRKRPLEIQSYMNTRKQLIGTIKHIMNESRSLLNPVHFN